MVNENAQESVRAPDIGGVVVYIAPAGADQGRKESIASWLSSKRGLQLNEGTYWFSRSVTIPAFSDFHATFQPLLPGELYVVLERGDVGITMKTFGRFEMREERMWVGK